MKNAIELLREHAAKLDKAKATIDASTPITSFHEGGVELTILAAEYRTAADTLEALVTAREAPPTPPRAPKKPKAAAAPPATVTPIAEAPKRRGRPRKSSAAGEVTGALPPANPATEPAPPPPPAPHTRTPALFPDANGAPAPVAEV